MTVSAQHDVMLDSWLGITSTNYRKIHDYSSVFDGVAVDLTESQVMRDIFEASQSMISVIKSDCTPCKTQEN